MYYVNAYYVVIEDFTTIYNFLEMTLSPMIYIINDKNKTNHPISSNSHPSATANIAIHCHKRGGIQNQREHHII